MRCAGCECQIHWGDTPTLLRLLMSYTPAALCYSLVDKEQMDQAENEGQQTQTVSACAVCLMYATPTGQSLVEGLLLMGRPYSVVADNVVCPVVRCRSAALSRWIRSRR